MAEEDELSRQAKSITVWPKQRLQPRMVWNTTDNQWEFEQILDNLFTQHEQDAQEEDEYNYAEFEEQESEKRAEENHRRNAYASKMKRKYGKHFQREISRA